MSNSHSLGLLVLVSDPQTPTEAPVIHSSKWTRILNLLGQVKSKCNITLKYYLWIENGHDYARNCELLILYKLVEFA